MTSLPGRDRTALLVVDVQNGVVNDNGSHRRDEVVANIAALVARARGEQVPVVWVQHSSDELPQGSPQWEYVAELAIAEGEPVVHKRYGDSFEDTPLEDLLAERGVGHLVVTGAQSDACIRATIHGGFTRGYDVTLVADAHTTEDCTPWGVPEPAVVVSFTNLYWDGMSAPGRAGRTVPTADVSFG